MFKAPMNLLSLFTLLNILVFIASEINIFYQLNEDIQAITNSLFFNLGLKQHFHRFENIQYMLSMHYKFRNMSEINIELFEITKDLHEENSQYKIIDSLFQTENVINEIAFNDSCLTNNITFKNIGDIINSNLVKIFSVATKIDNSYHKFVVELINKKPDHKFKNTHRDASDFKNISESPEPMKFMDDFLKKINSLTLNDFMKTSDNTSVKKTRCHLDNRYYDLKFWKVEKPTRRISNGKSTSILEYPFMVSIHVGEEFTCAGSIISRMFILTSASCLQTAYKNRLRPENLPNVSVRIGSDYVFKYGEVIPIVTIFFHPNYNPSYLKNNIAILKMEKHTYFRRNRIIRRIEFDNKNRMILENSNQVTLLGWGSRYTNQKRIGLAPISFADLSIFNYDMCKNIYSSEYVTRTNFCAGFVFKSGGACNKDVGGPAIINGVLVGIVSFGPAACGIPNSPTVFTKISNYYQWIQSVIREEVNKTYNVKDNSLLAKQSKNSSTTYNKGYFKQNNFKKLPLRQHHLREISKIKQGDNYRLVQHVIYIYNKLQQLKKSNNKTFWGELNISNARNNNNSSYKNSSELDGNYNFYSIESNYTDDEGLSIDFIKEEKTTKNQDLQGIKNFDHFVNSKERKEKLIEEQYINILENILNIPTNNRFKNIMRQAQNKAAYKKLNQHQSMLHS